MTEPLTARLVRLAERGPHADPRLVVARARSSADHAPLAAAPPPNRHRVGQLVAAAIVAAAVLAGIAGLANRDAPATPPAVAPSTEHAAPSTTAEPAQPAGTLPPADDLSEVPLTVPAGSPLQYWRFLPDLDVAERQTSNGSTELCWRSTAGQGCIDDTFLSPNVGVVPVAGGVVFLARPGLVLLDPAPTDPDAPRYELGPEPATVTARLSDGTTHTVDIERTDGFGVGSARLSTAAGITIVDATSS